MKGRKLQTVT